MANKNLKPGTVSPLMHAATLPSSEYLAKLLSKTTEDIDAPADDGWTALHYAAHAGYEKNVSLLLQAGANPHCKNTAGTTPSTIAISRGHLAAAVLLVKAEDEKPQELPDIVAELKKQVEQLTKRTQGLEKELKDLKASTAPKPPFTP